MGTKKRRKQKPPQYKAALALMGEYRQQMLAQMNIAREELGACVTMFKALGLHESGDPEYSAVYIEMLHARCTLKVCIDGALADARQGVTKGGDTKT